MKSSDRVDLLLAPYQPRLPVDQLVLELNRFYHASEARDYDVNHDEISRQLPPLWKEMVKLALRHLGDAPLYVLDFGCGTGFEADQLLRHLPGKRIAHLTCYDLSPEMLAGCRRRLAGRVDSLRLTNHMHELTCSQQPYNLVLTNSLLHHLPEPLETFADLENMLARRSVWLNGHEPSSRYYCNPRCRSIYEQFLAQRRIRKYLVPSRYYSVARKILGLRSNPSRWAAAEAYRRGLFRVKPPAALVSSLVDFHVAHSAREAESGRGFDFRRLEWQLRSRWRLKWTKTYAYMGPYYEARLPKHWQRACKNLADDHPDDGANYCAVWTR